MTVETFAVDAGRHGRRYCPVQIELDESLGANPSELALVDAGTGGGIPHQVIETGGKHTLRWIVDDLPEGGQRRYELKKTDTPAAPSGFGVSVDDTGETLRIEVGGSEFTTYNYGKEVVRPYFYPLFAAPSAGITRNWPMVPGAKDETNDHPHHKGLYTAQGEVNGVDNWGEGEGHGYQVHDRFDEVMSGPVAGGFLERLIWTDRDKKPNMAEERKVIFYGTPEGLRIIDYDVTLTAEFGDVTLGDTKEGGLISVRVATSMDGVNPDGGMILNAFGGSGEAETWGKRAHWCDYSGPVRGDWYGICMMDHPGNPRHPTYWHVRDYGLMTANCFGVHHFTADADNRKDFHIPAGESATWRYRALIHSGRGELAALTRCYHDFANPPGVTVE
jgi:hypothetical protein